LRTVPGSVESRSQSSRPARSEARSPPRRGGDKGATSEPRRRKFSISNRAEARRLGSDGRLPALGEGGGGSEERGADRPHRARLPSAATRRTSSGIPKDSESSVFRLGEDSTRTPSTGAASRRPAASRCRIAALLRHARRGSTSQRPRALHCRSPSWASCRARAGTRSIVSSGFARGFEGLNVAMAPRRQGSRRQEPIRRLSHPSLLRMRPGVANSLSARERVRP
jgi:hypothetical protein